VVSRLKRVRFGPVFLNSDLPMGRWREMSQYEVDILSAEVGLTPVAMPVLNAKSKDKLERLQRKSSRPVARADRVARTLRPAEGAPLAPRPARKPSGRTDRVPAGRGAPVAERPSEVNKRPPKPSRTGPKLVDDAPSGKRRGAPAGSGQRPGFGRRKPQ